MKANALLLVLFLTASFLHTVSAQFPNFPAADLVLGAADFTTVGSGAATPSRIDGPSGVAIDPITGKVFVSATSQHRILRFASSAALANGANAEAVIGQVNFSGSSSGATQGKFESPRGLFVDSKGRLWVADTANHRVLMFEGASTLSNGALADKFLGQPDFATDTPGTSNIKMSAPLSVFVDDNDNLWVVEQNNHRVIKFPAVSSLASGAAATVFIGQPDFATNTPGTTATKFNTPGAIAVDGAGRLWVADSNNSRILRFDNAASLETGDAASGVLGQSDFVSSSSGTTAQKVADTMGVVVDGSGTLYAMDFSNHRVLIFRNAAAKSNGAAADGVIGQPDFVSGGSGLSARQFTGPFVGLALDTGGRLWVADRNNDRVLRFSPDRTNPTLTFTSRIPRKTTKARLALAGKASDANGIAAVRFRVGKAAFALAKGTTSWKANARLKRGRNTIEAKATDTVGNESAARKATVRRE